MKKQIQLSLFLVLGLIVMPMQYAEAKQGSTMDDVTKALQAEYQVQLKNRSSRAKKKTRRRTKKNADLMLQYQRLLDQQEAKKSGKRQKKRQASPAARRAVARPTPPPVMEKPDAEDFFNAAVTGNINELSRLLQQGININVSNSQKETALHMAAARGRYSTVIFLINNGANPFARTVKQWLPIHHATRFRHANIANYLMQKGLSPHFKTSDGYSSIDMARTNHDRQLLSVFGAR